jgi:hypothetical protein
MKKKSSVETACEPRAEYNLETLLPEGIQGKYVERYRKGTNLILLEPDVAKAFPTQEAVNQALRLVMQLSGITSPVNRSTTSVPTKKRTARAA